MGTAKMSKTPNNTDFTSHTKFALVAFFIERLVTLREGR